MELIPYIYDMKQVYRHIRLDSNEIFYIGIGDEGRAYKKTGRNKHWKNIVNKHGYKIEIIYSGVTIEFAIEKEIELIKKYGRIDIGTGILVNMTDGGEGCNGIIHSHETKEKLSNHFKGIKLSIEHRDSISNGQVGKKWFNNGIDEVFRFDCLDGYEEGRIYRPTNETKMKMIKRGSENGMFGKPSKSIGKNWFNNGIENFFGFKGKEPDGYNLGRLTKKREHDSSGRFI
jgi:hypothetical protein